MSFQSLIFSTNLKLIRNVIQNKFYINNNLLFPSVVEMNQKRNGFFSVQTRKRRTTFPFKWLGQKDKKFEKKNNLTKDNKEFVDNYIKDKYELKTSESPLKTEPLKREEYSPGSRRTGVIAKKIGVYVLWTKSGKRLLTTVVQVVDNHVIKYHSPQEWEETCRPFYKYHPYKGLAVLVVGAESADPRKFASPYLGLFNEAAVLPKNKLTRFFITENSKLSLGTPLYATHFRVGDYVDIWGKTIDHGFQGVIKRWKFKGQDKYRGVTKAHRRPGTIGRGRKVMGPWKGHKMAGHMGDERRTMGGLKIWRINTKYNVMWIHGNCPGPTNSWVYIYDTNVPAKKISPDNPPPFPTHYPEEDEEPLPEEIYDKDLHAFNEPTIIFEETEAERKAAIALAKSVKKAKIAKIR